MTHDHKHHDPQHHHDHATTRRGWHQDWRAWVVVLLALAAMAMYVLSDDEAIQPGDPQPQPRMPAAE